MKARLGATLREIWELYDPLSWILLARFWWKLESIFSGLMAGSFFFHRLKLLFYRNGKYSKFSFFSEFFISVTIFFQNFLLHMILYLFSTAKKLYQNFTVRINWVFIWKVQIFKVLNNLHTSNCCIALALLLKTWI